MRQYPDLDGGGDIGGGFDPGGGGGAAGGGAGSVRQPLPVAIVINKIEPEPKPLTEPPANTPRAARADRLRERIARAKFMNTTRTSGVKI